MSRTCPNSYEHGCRCVEHAAGLGEYAPDPAAYARSLSSVKPLRLRVVTMPADPKVECAGTFTCPCEACERERQARMKHRPRTPRQPWERAA